VIDWAAPVILTGCDACRVRWLGALTVCPGCAADLGDDHPPKGHERE
jgi:hypothetical protein